MKFIQKNIVTIVASVTLCIMFLTPPCSAGVGIGEIYGPLSLDSGWPPQSERNPSWSPDGTKIVFAWGDGYTAWDPSFGRPNPDGSYIVTMTADGEAIRGPDNPLVNDVGWDNDNPDWSPDGNWIVYTKSRVGPAYISRVSLIDGTVVPITGTEGDPHKNDSMWHPHRAKWSPDGTKIAYLGGDWWNIFNPEPYHIWLTDPDGISHTNLTPGITGYGVIWLSWSPDGNEIVFTQPGVSSLFVVEVATGIISELPGFADSGLFPDAVVVWAEENSILFDIDAADGAIYDYQIDTQEITQLTYGPGVHLGDWHPTAGLVFSSARGCTVRWDSNIYIAVPVGISGVLTDGQNRPLAGAEVFLWNLTSPLLSKFTITNSVGKYSFSNLSSGFYRLQASLIYRNALSGDIIFQVHHGAPGVSPSSPVAYVLTEPFQVLTGESIEVDLDFPDASLETDPDIMPRARLVDLAHIYHYSTQVIDFVFDNLNATLDLDLPIDIYAYNPDWWWTFGQNEASGAFYNPPDNEIFIGENFSSFQNPHSPMNREWHELFHELMDDTIGLPPLPLGDSPHGGYANSSTSGSWGEGWAEFWPCALKFNQGDPNWDEYAVFGSLERNWLVWNMEEFAVAGVLLDLIDNDDHDNDENETDSIQIDIADLWSVIGNDNMLDNFKDVYDALIAANIGQADKDSDGLTDLDEIFIAHGFFVDNQNPGEVGWRQWNEGEEIGRAADVARPARRSTPETPGACVLTLAVNMDGFPTTVGWVRIAMEYSHPWDGYNSVVKRRLDRAPNGLVYLHPGPEQFNPAITIDVEDMNGNLSDSIKFSMDTYRQMVGRAVGPYVIAHEFEIGVVSQTIEGDVFADRLPSSQTWFSAYIELEANEQPEDIDLSLVQLTYAKGSKLSSPISAASDPCLPFVEQRITTDLDNDSIPELTVKFPRNLVLAALSPFEEMMSVTICWIDCSGSNHEGTVFLENLAPMANAGPDQIVECAYNTEQGTKVTLDGTDSNDPDGDTLAYTWEGPFVESPARGPSPTITLLDGCPGDYVITLVVSDGLEHSESDEVVITVQDTTAPELTLFVTPSTLWPPNHKMVKITSNLTVSDNCDEDPNVSLVNIIMNEGEETNTYDPMYDNTVGDGHTIDDIQIIDGNIYLRAERSGTGTGRIYTLTYEAVDNSGNATVQSATVTVPHDQL